MRKKGERIWYGTEVTCGAWDLQKRSLHKNFGTFCPGVRGTGFNTQIKNLRNLEISSYIFAPFIPKNHNNTNKEILLLDPGLLSCFSRKHKSLLNIFLTKKKICFFRLIYIFHYELSLMQPYHSSTNQSSHLKSLSKYEHPEILMEQRILQSK